MKRFTVILTLIAAWSGLLQAQYISQVFEYKPAPGQLINAEPWGTPSSVNSIIGGENGSLSLGAFGGYVVFGFDNAVDNDPDNPYGVDFTIFGNPSPIWAEPGMVWVMKDENANGLPDDTWYRLAGSDDRFSTTTGNYQVTYTNPGGETAANIPWTDNLGNAGSIFPNAFYPQSYYPDHDSFPGIDAGSYTLAGTCISGSLDTANPAMVISHRRAFGYADNAPRGSEPSTVPDNPYTTETENSGGDAFDISWAVDDNNEYVGLDKIHFVKVQTGMLANGGWLGEISTEITGAVDVAADASVTGKRRMVVMEDLPAVISNFPFQIEAFSFLDGRWQPEDEMIITTNRPWASVDENHLLTATQNGELEITASLSGNPDIATTFSTAIENASAIHPTNELAGHFSIFPNPAIEFMRIDVKKESQLLIFDGTGQQVRKIDRYCGQNISVSDFKKGLYFVKIFQDKISATAKFIKQ